MDIKSIVVLSRSAEKDLRKVPNHISLRFNMWVDIIERGGIMSMQKVRGYRDHSLKGERCGQRSSSLSHSWRIIYVIGENNDLIIIEVLEVNNHEY